MRGAGGTEGGVMRFFVGFGMMIAGGYLFLNSVRVMSGFGFGYGLYSFGGFRVTTGMILIPMLFGIGMIFYNSSNLWGWILALGSLLALSVGLIASVRMHFGGMSLFDLLVILILLVGGLGLFLNSLRDFSKG